MKYLYRYSVSLRDFTPGTVSGVKEPEYAFTIWFQGEHNAPPLVQSCFRSMRRNLRQKLVVLDQKTLFDWITLPDYIVDKWKAGKIKHTQFSDICRVELLYRHGGLWLDATDFVTSEVPGNIMDEDVFMFMAGDKVRGSYAMIQSCFIRAKKGNPLLAVWREAIYQYWENECSKVDYFVHHMLLRLSVEMNPIAALCFSEMLKIDQDPTHVVWFEHMQDKYDESVFKKMTDKVFFQKTNYKDKRLQTVKQGSNAEYILNYK